MVVLCNLEIVWWGLCNLEIVWWGYVTWRLCGGVI